MAPKRAANGAAKETYLVGHRIVFWASKSVPGVPVMLTRVPAAGGLLQPALAADSTEVVCPKGMTLEQAAARLKGYTGWAVPVIAC